MKHDATEMKDYADDIDTLLVFVGEFHFYIFYTDLRVHLVFSGGSLLVHPHRLRRRHLPFSPSRRLGHHQSASRTQPLALSLSHSASRSSLEPPLLPSLTL